MKSWREAIEASQVQKLTREMKRQLSSFEERSWFQFLSEENTYELVDLRVTAVLRICKEVLDADVQNYIRALTRGSMGSSAETVVEHPFIIAKQRNRENLDWKKLLVELQFRILDPY